jgi:hypothetical protein
MQAMATLGRILAHREDVLALSMGPLLHEMHTALQQHSQQPAGAKATKLPKLYLFSGHDTTVMPLAKTLGVDLQRWPPYCSNIVRLHFVFVLSRSA